MEPKNSWKVQKQAWEITRKPKISLVITSSSHCLKNFSTFFRYISYSRKQLKKKTTRKRWPWTAWIKIKNHRTFAWSKGGEEIQKKKRELNLCYTWNSKKRTTKKFSRSLNMIFSWRQSLGPLQVRNFEWEVLRLPNALLRLVIVGVTH